MFRPNFAIVKLLFFCSLALISFQVLDSALTLDADEESKKALTRVVVTKKELVVKDGSVPNKIEGILTGAYKDFILGYLAGEEK